MSQLKVDTIRHTSASSDAITLASDGTATAKITNPPPGNRNLIINGAMNIWQRGNGPYTIAYDYTADRWGRNFSLTGSDYFHIAKSTDSPDGFSSSLEASCGTAQATISATHYAVLRYRIEGQDLQHLKTGTANAVKTTLSFWAKTNAANSGDTYSVCIGHNDVSGNDRFQHRTFTPTSTWQKFTMTFDGQTAISIRNDNGYGLQLFFFLAAGSSKVNSATTTWGATGEKGVTGQSNFFDSTSNEFFVTGVQLEVGDYATEFEHRTYADELRRCQRYYYFAGGFNSTDVIGEGRMNTTTACNWNTRFPVEMRATPTLDHANGSNYYAVYSDNAVAYFDGAISHQNSGKTAYWASAATDSSFTQGHGTSIRSNNASAYVAFSAEL